MKNTNKTNKQEIKTVESVEEVETLSTLFTKRIQNALETESTLIDIPVLKNDLSGFVLTPFETYLPKYLQDTTTAKIQFKNAVVVACYNTIHEKARKHYNELKSTNILIEDAEGVKQWFITKGNDITNELTKESDVEYINRYDELESVFNELNKLTLEYRNNLEPSLQTGNIIIKMIVSKICKTQLPSFFQYSVKNDEKKDNTLINNIVHHSTLILQGLNTWKNAEGKSVSLEKQVKADITRFYNEKIKPAVIEGGYTSEVIKNFNGACNTQMFRRVFSIINDGFKINEKGVLVPVYSGKKLGRELADMYISYLQGEFSIDNSK